MWALYLHFDVVLQLGIQEVKCNRLLKFRILWKKKEISEVREKYSLLLILKSGNNLQRGKKKLFRQKFYSALIIVK